jgi:DDE superfamily endonuclease
MVDLMKRDSMLFLGVPQRMLFIIDKLAARLPTPHAHLEVLITLRKLKLMESHKALGYYFGVGKGKISKIFRGTLPTISDCLQELIFTPKTSQISLNLPLAFRYEYFEASDVVDAFEIEIQKPKNAKYQMLTYSAYKSCNTVKYIVNVTPDGYITFVSLGFGGRLSDVALCEASGYLETLRSGGKLLADRGFKHLENLLLTIGVELVRPPSICNKQPMSVKECSDTKKIAALRIHVERAIGRLRGFAFIAPHSTVPVPMIPLLDKAVIVACGLTNLASLLIKV